MLTQPNECGGNTLIFTEDDNLDAVPDSHRDIVTDVIREAFENPVAYFTGIANRTEVSNLRKYLNNFVSAGRWQLLLADTYMMERDTLAGFNWMHPGQHPCLFGVRESNCVGDRFNSFYSELLFAHWDSIGYAGGLLPVGKQIMVEDYGKPSVSSRFPADSTTVFGNSSCGDMMVCNIAGEAGFLSHEDGESYAVGTVTEMLNWVFGELIQGRSPEFDYSRCE